MGGARNFAVWGRAKGMGAEGKWQQSIGMSLVLVVPGDMGGGSWKVRSEGTGTAAPSR